jgi:hypothetical protein
VSDVPQGPGWWQASDGKWYSPEQFPGRADHPTIGGLAGPYAAYQPGAIAPRNEPLAVWSLVLAISGVVLACCWIGIAATIAAVVMGVIARRKIRDSHGMLQGDGLALAGIIIGSIGTVLGIGIIVLNIIFSATTWYRG